MQAVRSRAGAARLQLQAARVTTAGLVSGHSPKPNSSSSDSSENPAIETPPPDTAALGTAMQVANVLISHQTSLAATNTALGDRLEALMESKFSRLQQDVDTKLIELNQDVDAKLRELNQDVDAKLSKLNQELDAKLSRLDLDVRQVHEDQLKLSTQLKTGVSLAFAGISIAGLYMRFIA